MRQETASTVLSIFESSRASNDGACPLYGKFEMVPLSLERERMAFANESFESWVSYIPVCTHKTASVTKKQA